MNQNPPTHELLAEYTVLMNRHGVDSVQAEDYLRQFSADAEFVSLANVAKNLKRAMQTK